MSLTPIKENEKMANLGSDYDPLKMKTFEDVSSNAMKNQSQLKGLSRGPGIAKRMSTLLPV